MLILILIDVQYSQKAVFSFEKGLNGQNHSSSGSHHLVKKIHLSKISDSPLYPQLLTTIWKTLETAVQKKTRTSIYIYIYMHIYV